MPQKRNKPPPEVMTWSRATPVLVLCVIFDAFRFMFVMFWFFGPAMAALFCTIGVNEYPGTSVSVVTGKVVAVACVGGAATFGAIGMPWIEMFGVVMAMAVGLIGWLTIFLIQLLNNAGIFKENFAMIIRFAIGLLLSEIPIINALPSLTIINITMFHIQIKKGKEELQKWEEENADAQAQERKQQINAVQTRIAQQQAANDETYNNEEIPEEVREAA